MHKWEEGGYEEMERERTSYSQVYGAAIGNNSFISPESKMIERMGKSNDQPFAKKPSRVVKFFSNALGYSCVDLW